MGDIFDEFDRIARDFFEEDFPKTSFHYRIGETRYSKPFFDVFESESEVFVIVELPGVSEKEARIEVHSNLVIVNTGEKEKLGFFAKIPLPSKVKAHNFSKTFKNGVLELIFKKN